MFIHRLDFIRRYFNFIKYSISFFVEFLLSLGSGPRNQKLLAGLIRSSLYFYYRLSLIAIASFSHACILVYMHH